MKQTFLITGFEPFGGAVDNNSWNIAQAVVTKWANDGNPDLDVVSEILPVVWGTAKQKLIDAVNKHKPDYLLSLGLYQGITCLVFEEVAHNEAIGIPDNEGKTFVENQWGTVAIEGGKELQLYSTLPKQWLLTNYSPFIHGSSDAMGYLCNYVFYQGMSNFENINTKGFLHVCETLNIEGTEKAIEIIFELIKHISTSQNQMS